MAAKPVRRDLAPLRASDAPSLYRLALCLDNRDRFVARIVASVIRKFAARVESELASPAECAARCSPRLPKCGLWRGHLQMHDNTYERWV